MILRHGYRGDSMEPRYHNGSVALIRETGFDYDGAVYAVVWNGQIVYLSACIVKGWVAFSIV